MQINIPELLDPVHYSSAHDRHADFDKRAESLTRVEASGTDNTGSISLETIESVKLPDQQIRLTAIITATGNSQFDFGNYTGGCEIFMLTGDVQTQSANRELTIGDGCYLRIPGGSKLQFKSIEGCTLLIKLGQMSSTDTEQRLIETGDESMWLPGPAEGTEVFPLHLHETKNVLLIRWNQPAYFKPQLDPQGEELFVIKGTLHDAYGSYPTGSWIRNPVPAWQAWGGHAGSLVYYKNGHFP